MTNQRFFNTAGPVKPKNHYCLPPLSRFNLDEILALIAQEKYFILHAPRQTGKTSALLALMTHLNEQGAYRCLYINVEEGQTARGDVERGMRAILGHLASRARTHLKDDFPLAQMQMTLELFGGHRALHELLSQWASQSPQPLVLLIDEIDSLVGDTLLSVLRQLRAGYDKRPEAFPQSVVLCGVRDVRDYRIYSDQEQELVKGGSTFNIRAESLRLGNFSQVEVKTLYQQHTAETGQIFSADALQVAWELTQGQPWLVNALAYETTFKLPEGKNRNQAIGGDMIYQAKENLIIRRETHLDQLSHKLEEERVQRVIEPILVGLDDPSAIPPDDINYVRDLGLIETQGQLRIANKIYQEVIPRELTYSTQLTISHQPSWYIDKETGRLAMEKLLTAFQSFFRQHSEHWLGRFDYQEAGPQLLLQAFLQRIINSGGRVEREYGLGYLRTDLLIVWPLPPTPLGDNKAVQQVALELKLHYQSPEKTITAGLPQTWAYMDKCGAEEGHLLIFDRRKKISWDKKIFREMRTYQGQTIMIWGM